MVTKKIMRSIRIMSRLPSRIRKWNQLSQLRWTSTTVIHFDDEPRVQERQQVKDQQSYISVFVAYPTITSSNYEHQPRHNNNIPCITVWWISSKLEYPFNFVLIMLLLFEGTTMKINLHSFFVLSRWQNSVHKHH